MIKVLRRVGSTTYTRGPDDFNYCDDGELLVMFGGCDNGANCGCAQAFTGLDTLKSTTRATVVELDISEQAYQQIIATSPLMKAWPSLSINDAITLADTVLNAVEAYPPGQVVLRHDDRVVPPTWT